MMAPVAQLADAVDVGRLAFGRRLVELEVAGEEDVAGWRPNDNCRAVPEHCG